ncbi:MAG TPA: mechanosensitive ion channel family protein [Verrucomicrobiae bacterium]
MNSTRFPVVRTIQVRLSNASLWAWKTPALLALALLVSRPCGSGTAQGATAQPTAAVETTASQNVPVPDDPLERGTPRSSVEKFFGSAQEGDFVRAARYLDLSRVAEDKRGTEGPRLARELWIVLERKARIDFSSLSANPLGESNDGLPPNRERLAQLEWAGGLVDVSLERVREPNGLEVWKVSSHTVGQVPKWYAKFRIGWAERVFSEQTINSLLRTHVLGLSLFTWMELVWSVCVWAVLVFIALKLAKRAVRLIPPGVTANLVSALYVPLIVILITVAMRNAVPRQSIPEELAGLLRGRTILVVVAVWMFFRLVDFCGERARTRLLERDGDSGFHLVDLLRRVAKVALVVIGLIVWLDNLGFKVSTIVASLGIIGLAVGLASQKFIEDLIAAMTLHATGVVKRNEAIRFGDKRGVVEDIGLRMIKIRSGERTVVTMPNALFAAMQIENFGRRDKIPFQPRLGLRYETTPDQLRFVLIELRKLLIAHPKVINESARVRFVGFGPCSLEVDLSCFVRETNSSEYLAIAEDLNLRIMDIIARAGTGFALPSQTIYFERGHGTNKTLARQAEDEVRRWREQGQLFQHKFDDETIEELTDTLKYPDAGTADGPPKDA